MPGWRGRHVEENKQTQKDKYCMFNPIYGI